VSVAADVDGPIRIALADDSFLMREAMQHVLGRLDGVEVVAVCAHGERLLETVDRERPRVVVTDVRMPPSGDDEGIRVARRLRVVHPEVGVVVLNQHAEPRYGPGLLDVGAVGRAFLLKERIQDQEQHRDRRRARTKRAVEKHVGAIFLRLGLRDEQVISRRVTAVLMYLAEADDPDP
jgi:CheY-like chemotaxis protein